MLISALDEKNGQLQTLAALAPGKQSCVAIE
jgi:hypothetical protein